MLAALRRRKRSRSDPTPAQAFDALEQGSCMWAPVSKCSGRPFATGLRGWEDVNDVLVCKAHAGRLRRLDERRLLEYERFLLTAFRPR